MIDNLLGFFSVIIRDIPTSLLVGFLVLFGVGTILLLVLLGGKRGSKWSAGLMLLEYMSLLLLLAVLTRTIQANHAFSFTPFWSYQAYREGVKFLLTQNIANVFAFIPVGLLLGFAFGRMKWWKVLLIGGGFSVLIEALQFFLKRGFAEFDDVFHNVLGCMIGFGVYVGIVRLWAVLRQAQEPPSLDSGSSPG